MAYIKLDDALKVCSDYEEWYADMNDQCGATIADNIYQEIVNLTTADVVEVKHGRWKSEMRERCDWKGRKQQYYQPNSCSVCHEAVVERTPYCPHCGAKMDGGNAE